MRNTRHRVSRQTDPGTSWYRQDLRMSWNRPRFDQPSRLGAGSVTLWDEFVELAGEAGDGLVERLVSAGFRRFCEIDYRDVWFVGRSRDKHLEKLMVRADGVDM